MFHSLEAAIGDDRPKTMLEWQERLTKEFWAYDPSGQKLEDIFQSLEVGIKGVISTGGDNNYKRRKTDKAPPKNYH